AGRKIAKVETGRTPFARPAPLNSVGLVETDKSPPSCHPIRSRLVGKDKTLVVDERDLSAGGDWAPVVVVDLGRWVEAFREFLFPDFVGRQGPNNEHPLNLSLMTFCLVTGNLNGRLACPGN